MTAKNSSTHRLGDVVDVTIDSLSYSGGRGVGRVDGMVIFVPATAPGDFIRARITAKRPKFLEGKIEALVKPSPTRRVPPCAIADRCGGCSWQHVEYATQVEQKQGILSASLRGLKKLGDFQLLPLLPAPAQFHYRNRIQLQYRDGKYGFFAKGTNDLVEVRECWISDPALNNRIVGLLPDDAQGFSKVELALTPSGEVRTTAGKRPPEAATFAQVNQAQNEVLKSRVLELVRIAPAWVYDLYAGSGNLTGPLAEKFGSVRVVGVELSQAAVERSRVAAEWLVGDVGRVLAGRKLELGDGLIVLDPPRTGCEMNVSEQLLRLRPKQIIYVSCNPSTFARDAERLMKGGQYQLVVVQGLDMFPQTEHVELIASLIRR